MTNEELINLAKNGDKQAKELLFEKNQPFIYKTAHKYRNIAEFDDLVGLGNIGLLKAYNTFDINKGLKFITYYSRIVVNEILYYFRRSKKFKKETSINKSIYSDSEGNDLTIFDMQEDEEAYEQFYEYEKNEISKQVLELFHQNENQRMIDVLNHSIIKGLKQQDVAKEIGIQQAQVSRLKKKVEERLNTYYKQLVSN